MQPDEPFYCQHPVSAISTFCEVLLGSGNIRSVRQNIGRSPRDALSRVARSSVDQEELELVRIRGQTSWRLYEQMGCFGRSLFAHLAAEYQAVVNADRRD